MQLNIFLPSLNFFRLESKAWVLSRAFSLAWRTLSNAALAWGSVSIFRASDIEWNKSAEKKVEKFTTEIMTIALDSKIQMKNIS